MTGDAEERYRAALQDRGLADVRPLYRELLVRLKKEDESAYEEAVLRYDEEVEPALQQADDPLVPWLRYGAWLARRLTPGELTAVGPDGAASEVEPGGDGGDERAGKPDGPESGGGTGPLPAGALLLHLPEDDGEPGIALAVPDEPTPHQEAAREILCG